MGIPSKRKTKERKNRKSNHSRKGTLIIQAAAAAFVGQESEEKMFRSDACQMYHEACGVLGDGKKAINQHFCSDL